MSTALPVRTKVSAHARDRSRAGMLFALPTALVVGVFFVVPLGLLVWMSFNHWPLIGASRPNGLADYAAVTDPLFVRAITFTLLWTVLSTAVLLVVSLGLALLVQEARRGVGLFRTLFLLPVAVGMAAATLMFYSLFMDPGSPLNSVLSAVGIGPVDWIGTRGSVIGSTLLLVTWRFAGFYMLILLTGLQAIPAQLYEAARVDGADAWTTFRSVTLPLLRPSLSLTLLLSVTGGLLSFEQFFIMTAGGPDNSAVTLVLAVYRQAFTLFDLGRAAAMSVVLLIVLLGLNTGQFVLLRRGAED
ncbi:L-arabinose transport system permease protein AraP [Streptomyces sp. enrichment culture]|uniref:carbohydrate ABC transporter permease n=1 Tax=Streptomyces sp. enrichment culture TaxID=1795815 RepID=UPI003F54C994